MSLHDRNLKKKNHMNKQKHILQDQSLTNNFILLLIRDVKDVSSVTDAFDHYPDHFASGVALIPLFQENIQETHSSSRKDRYV